MASIHSKPYGWEDNALVPPEAYRVWNEVEEGVNQGTEPNEQCEYRGRHLASQTTAMK